MYTHTVTVTIGRKIGPKAMPAERWAEFKVHVLLALGECSATVLQHPQLGKMRAHDQVGVWEGQTEPAATFVALIGGYHNIRTLKEMLAVIAGMYEQQAIGCVVTLGTDHLVMP